MLGALFRRLRRPGAAPGGQPAPAQPGEPTGRSTDLPAWPGLASMPVTFGPHPLTADPLAFAGGLSARAGQELVLRPPEHAVGSAPTGYLKALAVTVARTPATPAARILPELPRGRRRPTQPTPVLRAARPLAAATPAAPSATNPWRAADPAIGPSPEAAATGPEPGPEPAATGPEPGSAGAALAGEAGPTGPAWPAAGAEARQAGAGRLEAEGAPAEISDSLDSGPGPGGPEVEDTGPAAPSAPPEPAGPASGAPEVAGRPVARSPMGGGDRTRRRGIGPAIAGGVVATGPALGRATTPTGKPATAGDPGPAALPAPPGEPPLLRRSLGEAAGPGRATRGQPVQRRPGPVPSPDSGPASAVPGAPPSTPSTARSADPSSAPDSAAVHAELTSAAPDPDSAGGRPDALPVGLESGPEPGLAGPGAVDLAASHPARWRAQASPVRGVATRRLGPPATIARSVAASASAGDERPATTGPSAAQPAAGPVDRLAPGTGAALRPSPSPSAPASGQEPAGGELPAPGRPRAASRPVGARGSLPVARQAVPAVTRTAAGAQPSVAMVSAPALLRRAAGTSGGPPRPGAPPAAAAGTGLAPSPPGPLDPTVSLVAARVGRRAPDGSVLFEPPPGVEVHRQVDPAPPPDAPPSSPPPAPVAPGPPAGPPGAAAPDPAALADDLYERVERRLRTELLLERERKGLLADLGGSGS